MMNLGKTATYFTENVVAKVSNKAPFGKFERITAGFCMAIPFYLIVADQGNAAWMLVFPILITLLPLIIPTLVRSVKDSKNHGLVITLTGGALLFGLYILFTNGLGLQAKPSISAYVNMEDAYIFGMLLAIASMLFMASGAVFYEKKERADFLEGGWRSLINVLQGLLLLGVIIFPCDEKYTTHMVFAITFFLGCGLATLARPAKDGKKLQHKLVDFLPVSMMLLAMVIHFGRELFGWFGSYPFTLVNLFGAESIALWVTGLDFILVSLKREIDPSQPQKNVKAKKMVVEKR
jgi:hypothetical protein